MMWWVVGLAAFTIVAFILVGFFKGYIWEKEDQLRHKRRSHARTY